MRGAMDDKFYAAQVRFICPVCEHRNSELQILLSPTPDTNLMAKRVGAQQFKCQSCGSVAPLGTMIDVGFRDATAEEISRVRFSPPKSGDA